MNGSFVRPEPPLHHQRNRRGGVSAADVQLGDRLFFLGSRGHPGHASTKTPEMRGLFPRVPNIGKSLFAGLLMADLQTADLCHDRHQAPAEPSIGTPDEADMVRPVKHVTHLPTA